MSKLVKIHIRDNSFFFCEELVSVFGHSINKFNPFSKFKYVVNISFIKSGGFGGACVVYCKDKAEATELKRNIETQFDQGSV